jgi:hypothetical protein
MPLVLVVVAIVALAGRRSARQHRDEAEEAAQMQALALLWALRSIRAEACQLAPPEPLCTEPEPIGGGCFWTLVLGVLLVLILFALAG